MDEPITCKTPEPFLAKHTTTIPETSALPGRGEPPLAPPPLGDQSSRATEARAEGLAAVDETESVGPGTLLAGRYLLAGEIDRGGIGLVYRATDLRTAGTVAVKFIHPMLAGDPAYRERLRREARFAAAIISPLVVRIFDLDEHAGMPFLVMEYVAGETLKDRLGRQGRFPLLEALTIGGEITRALEAAHAYGIVHRDLKPENVMLIEGHVKVLDFGIAWAEGLSGLTIEGAFVGTPEYSAPERALGQGDIRSDIYSIGVILFVLIEGQLPFRGPTPVAVLRQQESEPPPPLRFATPSIQAVVARCLAKDPADRYQTPSELMRALSAASAAPHLSSPDSSLVTTQIHVTLAHSNTRGQLPLHLTSFVGREEARAGIRRLLLGEATGPASRGGRTNQGSSVRLLTLTGVGGSGKTRLAVQVASELASSFADGVVLVELAPLAEPSLVAQAIAMAGGVRDAWDRGGEAALIDALRSRHLLLVLDNCEHLVEACATLAEPLLRSCPHLSILATSREPLGIMGETVWPVSPLATPSQVGLPAFERLVQYESVRLFVDRAKAACPTFTLTPHNAAAIANICRRLDGIPLAIELAAARVRVMSVEQIAARLDDRFRLLTGGSRAAPPRQKTLRATIDWSYDLLGLPERTLFRRLASFAGSFVLDAVAAVCRGGMVTPEMALDLLTHLVDRSLVAAEALPDTDEGTVPEVRYRLLETIREYAAERLREAGEDQSINCRHAAWFLTFAERATRNLDGSDQAQWLSCLESEHDNVRHALRWSAGQAAQGNAQAGALALRLSAAMWRFWFMRAYFAEGRQWLVSILDLTTREPSELTCPASDDPPVAQTDRQTWRVARADALNGAANLAHSQGDEASARALHLESLAIRRELGDQTGIAASLNNLGVVSRAQGDYVSARELFEEALAINHTLGHQTREAVTLDNLGNVASDMGDYALAHDLFQRSYALHHAAGDTWGEAMVLNDLGSLAMAQGDYNTAQMRHRAALIRQHQLGGRSGIVVSFSGLGTLACLQGDYVRAAVLLSASDALRTELGFSLPASEWNRHEESLVATRNALGEAASSFYWAAGSAFSLDQAIHYALDQ
jgi:predicted ATPase/serine/threonine protein kinase